MTSRAFGWLAIALVAGCTPSRSTTPAPVVPPPTTKPAPTKPEPKAPIDPKATAVIELIRLARVGDTKTLEAMVDWPYVQRLAKINNAFTATTAHLVATLSSLPAKCDLEWRLDEGGTRLDFAPALVGDPPDVAAEKNAIKSELYRGTDVIAMCVHQSEDLYDDGHSELVRIPEERFVVQLVGDAAAGYHIRGWSRLK